MRSASSRVNPVCKVFIDTGDLVCAGGAFLISVCSTPGGEFARVLFLETHMRSIDVRGGPGGWPQRVIWGDDWLETAR